MLAEGAVGRWCWQVLGPRLSQDAVAGCYCKVLSAILSATVLFHSSLAGCFCGVVAIRAQSNSHNIRMLYVCQL